MRTHPPKEGSDATPSTPSPAARPSRRRFLLTLGVGGAGAASMSAGVLPAAAATASGTEIKNSGDGYRETEHVRDYYRSAKL
jgi:hypothetical protein